MQQISSKLTFFHKRIFPIIWFGVLAAIFMVNVFGTSDADTPMALIVPIVMAVVGYVFMKKLIFDLVDEVFDDGDTLLIRNGGKEDRVALANIMNVGYSVYTNPPRVTLALRKPSIFGDSISFCAPVRFIPYTTSPIIDELIVRVDAKRSKR